MEYEHEEPQSDLRIQKMHAGASPEVERLWYSVYVDELGYCPPSANHAERRLREPFAKTGSLQVALDTCDRPVGTILTVYGHEADFGDYRDLYQLEGSLEGLAFTTRLVVARAHRYQRLTLQLAMATYCEALPKGVRTAHIDVQPINVRLFEKLGYRTGELVEHPLYGTSRHMVLDLLDLPHLRAVRSPFLPLARRFVQSSQARVAQ